MRDRNRWTRVSPDNPSHLLALCSVEDTHEEAREVDVSKFA